jgi:ElaB/YqjD/DUF883 family membrane-anchored ribosome-binding protein
MAEPVRNTPDFPSFDTYPSKLEPDKSLPPAGQGTPGRLGEIPGLDRQRTFVNTEDEHSAWNSRAAKLGGVVGSAVREARQVPRHLQALKNRFPVITGRTRVQAGAGASDLKENVQQRLARARTQARDYACRYPLQVIGGAAAVAFVLGFSLRVWRGNHG